MCLLKLGSIYHLEGLVVCDSKLNSMKTQLYKLKNPVGEVKWQTNCMTPVPRSLEKAMAYVQTVLAVFDYYNDPNVKKRHEYAYQLVMHEMETFEFAYDSEFHLNTNIFGRWQRHWQLFMTAQFSRIRTWARLWVGNKLIALLSVWRQSLATVIPQIGAGTASRPRTSSFSI